MRGFSSKERLLALTGSRLSLYSSQMHASAYDGGDCCECTCTTISFSICIDFDCIDPIAVCVKEYIEAGTKTNVFVSADADDTRLGQASGGMGCMGDGCVPALTRDGISDDIDLRLSCIPSIVPDGGLREIEFVFE